MARSECQFLLIKVQCWRDALHDSFWFHSPLLNLRNRKRIIDYNLKSICEYVVETLTLRCRNISVFDFSHRLCASSTLSVSYFVCETLHVARMMAKRAMEEERYSSHILGSGTRRIPNEIYNIGANIFRHCCVAV